MLIGAYEVALVFLQDYDFTGAAWVFLGLNMMFMALIAGQLDPVQESDTVDGVLNAMATDQKVTRTSPSALMQSMALTTVHPASHVPPHTHSRLSTTC